MEFRNGLLLSLIIEKVEHSRPITGLCHTPRNSHASALHNISKLLRILQQKSNMPTQYLHSKEEIYSGHRTVILSLLSQIKKAYGYKQV